MAKDKSANKSIAIIGGGHMGVALAEGFRRSDSVRSLRIRVADPSPATISRLKKHGIQVTSSNIEAALGADIIFLAVKPHLVRAVANELEGVMDNALLVSAAAGVTMSNLERYAGKSTKIARIMPNMPAMYSEGVIGFYAGSRVTRGEAAVLKRILSRLGFVVEVKKENHLETLTLVSGCGPAIVSYFMQMMQGYAERNHLDERVVSKVIAQTFTGTLRYLAESGISPAGLVRSVATKGGVTEAIIQKLDRRQFRTAFVRAMERGRMKLQKLKRGVNQKTV